MSRVFLPSPTTSQEVVGPAPDMPGTRRQAMSDLVETRISMRGWTLKDRYRGHSISIWLHRGTIAQLPQALPGSYRSPPGRAPWSAMPTLDKRVEEPVLPEPPVQI